MKALIFGIAGQDGHYLRELLIRNQVEVIGVSRSAGNWFQGTVTDFELVCRHVQQKPDFVFHLAANSSTKHNLLFENHEAISTGTLNILEAVYRYSPQTKVFLSCSALQFINNGHPINEQVPFDATSPYALSRIHSTYAGRYYRKLGIKAYTGYFFHHDSPLRSENHINMKIVRTVQRIKNGSRESIEIGNVDVIKEYNYAADLMEAVWILVNQDKEFEAVIGSGRGYAIKAWLQICFDLIGKDWEQFVKSNESFRPEFMSLVSDPSLLFSLGWKPKHNIQQLASLMLNHS